MICASEVLGNMRKVVFGISGVYELITVSFATNEHDYHWGYGGM